LKVQVERRGGIAGVTLTSSTDTSGLPPAAALAAEAALRALPVGSTARCVPYPDAFQYQITAFDGSTPRTVVLNEADLPDELRPVIDAAMAGAHLG
jgi:hypothetical protein